MAIIDKQQFKPGYLQATVVMELEYLRVKRVFTPCLRHFLSVR